MDPRLFVPTEKGDVVAAQRAVAAGYPAVAPVLSDLFGWLRDGNWPVFAILAPFLVGIGMPIVTDVKEILGGHDDIWKYWVLSYVSADASLEVLGALRDVLLRIANSPTLGEKQEEIDVLANEALARLGR
jgi:hypothetical protein